MRLGLALLALAAVLVYGGPFASGALGEGMLLYLALLGLAGALGFGLLVASTFLPSKKDERPTFTQELMGKESLNYGAYTDGNWISVLDKKDKEEKEHKRR